MRRAHIVFIFIVGVALFVPSAAFAQGQVTKVVLSPASPVAPGTNVTVTVNGTTPCGAVEINFGDATNVTFPVSSLPFAQQHRYPNVGTFVITAKGQGNCGGVATATLVVANPTPPPPPPPPPPPTNPTDLTVSLQVATPAVTGTSDPVVVLAHNGPVAAEGVTVLVTLDGNWTLSPSGPGAGCVTQSSVQVRTQIVCTAGAMAANAVKSFRVDAAAPAHIIRGGSSVSVEAEIDPGNHVAESNETNNRATATVALEERADLVADGSALPATGSVSQDLTYPVRVKNVGDALASNVGVRVFLPKQVDFIRAQGTEIGNCVPAHPAPGLTIVNCTAATIAPGGAVAVDLVTRPIVGLVDGDKIDVKVQIDPSNDIAERNENNNIVSAQTTLSVPTDLAIVSVTVERRRAIPLPGPSSPPLSCAADQQATPASARSSNTIVHVLIKNNGPGQTVSATAGVSWAVQAFPSATSDCAPGTHCVQGVCRTGAAPANPAICFDHCAIPAIFPGQTLEILFFADRGGDADVLGTVTIDPDHRINDADRTNNARTIR